MGSTAGRRVRRLRAAVWTDLDDVVATEEPLEIRLLQEAGGAIERHRIAVTMRTPGHDFELAAGFLFGESIVTGREDILDISYCTDEEEPQRLNIVNVTLRPTVTFDAARLERNFYTTSSCGVCGKAALESLEIHGCTVLPHGLAVPASLICRLPGRLREQQAVFARTGGLHAAGLFGADGALLRLREDVGRHNALDKLVGAELIDGGARMRDAVLMLSGRASFELLQKALAAQIPIVAAVGAPSSLAVELAESFDITLLGFVRDDGFNVYAGGHRIADAPAPE
ncbi:MAG: formate dehydrogenase accessory sulfurtransferase FdhD [Dehalococcoidia bacterium]|nr:formate dehydrogenase accessory sulfurtransferase FdhD [Dehalococcoidia bacterium]